MDQDSDHFVTRRILTDTRPILIVPYMWIGDFVRGHTVVRVLKQRWPNRPVDILVTPQRAPLVDYMPGLRRGSSGICRAVGLPWPNNGASRRLCGPEQYGTALVLPRTWKSALRRCSPVFLNGLALSAKPGSGSSTDGAGARMRCLGSSTRTPHWRSPDGAPLPAEWPVPQLRVPELEIERWRQAHGLGSGRAVALAPGSVGAAKRWSYYPEAARQLVARGLEVWVVGGPDERALAAEIIAAGGQAVRDLTGPDLRNGILAMAAADVAVSNDSGLMHIAAALGTPTMGIFGPTSPYHWAPLNGLAATVQTKTAVPCQPCHRPICTQNNHRCMRDIPAEAVVDSAARVLQKGPTS